MSLRPMFRCLPMLIAGGFFALGSAGGAQATTCRAEAKSLPTPPIVVELYTSEACSSCPPADRWLSGLADDRRILALGFHVNYWDHLGWKDRMASPATTRRQHGWKAALGAAYVYTPQVIVNGVDERAWGSLTGTTLPRLMPAVVPDVQMRREGTRVQADVAPVAGVSRLAGYWAVLAAQVRSEVTRGENAGRTLTHAHVVSRYLPVAPWAAAQAQQVVLDLGSDPGVATSRVAFVVTAEDGLRPLQAVSLGCP